MSLRGNFLYLCVRIPKSGSSSLGRALSHGLADARRFYLPNTLELDGRLSRFQHFRFRRSQIRNLMAHYGTPRLKDAFSAIDSAAAPGDLLTGGHIDFPVIRRHLKKPVKIITILRNPYARCRSEYHYARQKQLKKSRLARFDSNVVPQIAAKYDFESYLDFLLDHRHAYGDIANAYLGLDRGEDIASFFEDHVFHAGVLENSAQFARGLAEKLGRPIEFPHLNKTESGQHVALGAAAKRKIENLYARDFALYEWQLDAAPARTASRGASRGGIEHRNRDIAEYRPSRSPEQPKAKLGAKRTVEATAVAFQSLSRSLHLLFRLARDNRLPVAARSAAAAGFGYGFSPVQLIPDSVPVLGYVDDLFILALCMILAKRLIPARLIAEHLASIGFRSR